ncbi:MAG: cyclodeaminase/cyclohydrolase family protein [Caldilineaceae bacterium]
MPRWRHPRRPAGGSAAAVTAAQGAALLAMAAAITVRRTSPMPAATDLTRRRSGSRGCRASAGIGGGGQRRA